MKILLFVCIAGAIGTLIRYLSVKAVSAAVPDPFWATLAVNVAGAFIAGFCFILCKNKLSIYQHLFPVLFAGFLGGFTTFSAFALESVKLFADAHYSKFFVNVLLHNLCGLGAAMLGLHTAKLFFKS